MTETLPTASPWFTGTDLGGGVVRVTEPHLHSLVEANAWWIRGADHDVVIDTGLGVASLREHLPWMFENQPLAVLTHTHLDHVGGAWEFDHVAAHAAEAPAVSRPAPASLHTETELGHLGIEATGFSFPELLLEALPSDGFDPATYAVRPARVTRTLRDGDVIDLGDRRLLVLHSPGHSPGSIVLLDESTRVLYSGDVIYEGGLLDEMHGADIDTYVETMRRLLELDVAEVRAGHGDPFDGDRLREIASEYIERRG